jgi:hypothetical protein
MARPARPERNSAGSTGLNFKKRENNRDPAIVAALDHFAYFFCSAASAVQASVSAINLT